MGLLSHKVERNQINSGDHIYTWRAAYTYSHHGIYVGENKVVHFTCEPDVGGATFSSSFSSQHPWICPKDFPNCGSKKSIYSGVVFSCLDCFLGTGSLHCFEYGVTPSIFLAKRSGTCTIATSDPAEEAIRRAMYLYEKGFGNYDVLGNNCEDFSLYCKTSLLGDKKPALGRSGQATSFIGAPLAALLSSLLALLKRNWTPARIGAAVVTAGIYYMGSYANDLGVRTDVSKVPVEEMAVKFGWVGNLNIEEITEENESSDTQSPPNQLGTSSIMEQQTSRLEWDPLNQNQTIILRISEQQDEYIKGVTAIYGASNLAPSEEQLAHDLPTQSQPPSFSQVNTQQQKMHYLVPTAPLETQPNQEFDVGGGHSSAAELNECVLSDIDDHTGSAVHASSTRLQYQCLH